MFWLCQNAEQKGWRQGNNYSAWYKSQQPPFNCQRGALTGRATWTGLVTYNIRDKQYPPAHFVERIPEHPLPWSSQQSLPLNNLGQQYKKH